MSALELQGLLYLVSGSFAFFILATLLRTLSLRLEPRSSKTSHQEWQEPEWLDVQEVIQESPDIKSFLLTRREGLKFPPFLPGQFLSFQIADDPKTIRSYSLSSSPQTPRSVQISVKQLKAGVGSTWFHKLQPGDQVWSYPPGGHFVDTLSPSYLRVFIAGGVGITPFISMITHHHQNAFNTKIQLFFGAQKKQDLIYHDFFNHLSKRHSHFRYHPFLSQENQEGIPRGHITWEKIFTKGGLEKHPHTQVIFFLCGPAPMTEALTASIQQYVGSTKQIITEKFISPSTFDVTSIPETKAQITYNKQTFSYEGRLDLLSFLEKQGQKLPFACRSGVCGSCRCRIQGDYQQLTDAGLTDTEKQSGYTLTCVSYPKGDVTLLP